MDLTIPDGQIVTTPAGLTVHTDLGKLYAAHCLGAAYDSVSEVLDLSVVTDSHSMHIEIAGARYECPVRLMNLHGSGMVATLIRDNEPTYLLFREGGLPWQVSTRMFLLPDPPGAWSDDDSRFEQRQGRVLLFAGLALLNGWFRAIQ